MVGQSALRKIVGLALPMVSVQGLSVFSNFLCMLMLAHVSHQVLAASALIFSIQTTLMVTGTSLLMALAYLVGHANGAKDYGKVGIYVQHAWLIALVMGLFLFLICSFMGTILLALHEAPDLVKLVAQFFNIYRFALILILFTMSSAQVFYGTGQAKLVLWSGVLGAFFLLSLSFVFIHGALGFPLMGVRGLAIAAVFQYGVILSVLLTWFKFKESFKKFGIFHWRFYKNWAVLKQMLNTGWPIFVQMSGELIAFSAGAVMVGWLGVNQLAAYQIVIQCWFVLVIGIFGLSHSMGILIGQARGAEDSLAMQKLGRTGFTVTLVFVLIIALVFIVLPKNLANLYLDPHSQSYDTTLNLAIALFSIMAFNQFFDGFRNVITGALRGLLDTRFPMFLSLILIWLVGMPLSYLFGFALNFGLLGIAAGSTLGMLISVTMLSLRWNSQMKKRRG